MDNHNFARAIEEKRKEFVLKNGHYICALHFYSSDVKRDFDVLNIGGQCINLVKREKPILRDDALPRIFPNCPKVHDRAREEKEKATWRKIFTGRNAKCQEEKEV